MDVNANRTEVPRNPELTDDEYLNLVGLVRDMGWAADVAEEMILLARQGSPREIARAVWRAWDDSHEEPPDMPRNPRLTTAEYLQVVHLVGWGWTLDGAENLATYARLGPDLRDPADPEE